MQTRRSWDPFDAFEDMHDHFHRIMRRNSEFDVPFFGMSLRNWPFAVWNDFARIEDELERRFRHMER